MVTTGAIIHSRATIWPTSEEHPVALQLGGSDPAALAHCAKLAEQRGYDEINLNVGFARPIACKTACSAPVSRWARQRWSPTCIKAMRDVVSIPVTVKTRIGVDDQDATPSLCDFIQTVAGRGSANMFAIHARQSLSPASARKRTAEVPPLDYPRVYQLKAGFPGADHRH